MSATPPLVPLGFGTFARADRIYAMKPIEPGSRGPGRRTVVWVEGVAEPLVASRTEGAILRDMGGGGPGGAALAGDALDLARELERVLDGLEPVLRRMVRAESGVDLDALERRTRQLLERVPDDGRGETLF